MVITIFPVPSPLFTFENVTVNGCRPATMLPGTEVIGLVKL